MVYQQTSLLADSNIDLNPDLYEEEEMDIEEARAILLMKFHLRT